MEKDAVELTGNLVDSSDEGSVNATGPGTVIRRYVSIGFISGFLIILAATAIASQLQTGRLTLSGLWQVQVDNYLLWIIDTIPILLGLVSGLAGLKQARTETLARKLSAMNAFRTTELKLAKQRLESILENMADLIVVMDSDGIIEEVNRSTLRMFGYEPEELVGRSAEMLFGQSDLDRMLLKNTEDLFERGFLSNLEGAYRTNYGHDIHLNILISYIWSGDHLPKGIICVAQDISERLQREEVLKKSKQEFESLFQNAPMPIVIARDQHVVFYNEETVRRLGYSPDKLKNMGIEKIVHPEDLPQVIRNRNGLDTADLMPDEMNDIRVVTSTGDIRWVDLKVTRFQWNDQPSNLIFVVDNTERQMMEVALVESEKKFRDLVQTANVIILKMDPRFRITFMNRYGEHFFGYSEAELLGRYITDCIVPPQENAGNQPLQFMQELINNPAKFDDHENENVCKNGKRVWVSWRNKNIYDDKGNVSEIMSIGQDITAKKAADEKIREQHEILESNHRQMMDELEQAKKAQLALLPETLPSLPGIRLVTRYNPMAQIGGDFYDLFLNGPNRLGILVGDVTGHGIPAALLSFLFLAIFNNNLALQEPPDLAMKRVNRFLSGKLPKGKYATMFYCVYNDSTCRLEYTSAGHPPAFLVRPGSNDVIELQTAGMVVGMFENPISPCETRSIELMPGDKLLIYTDGLLEVFDGNHQLPDDNRLKTYLLSQKHQPIEQMVENVYHYCLNQANQKTFTDDVTMIGLEVNRQESV